MMPGEAEADHPATQGVTLPSRSKGGALEIPKLEWAIG